MKEDKEQAKPIVEILEDEKKRLSEIRAEAGRKGGLASKGVLHPNTIERTLHREAMARAIRPHSQKITDALFQAGLGQAFVYRLDHGSNKPVQVTDPEEIRYALEHIGLNGNMYPGQGNMVTTEVPLTDPETGEDKTYLRHQYYYISTKEPNVKALEVLLERGYGKVPDKIELDDESTDGVLTAVFKKAQEIRKQREQEAEVKDAEVVSPNMVEIMNRAQKVIGSESQ